jgi:hypothetical protein
VNCYYRFAHGSKLQTALEKRNRIDPENNCFTITELLHILKSILFLEKLFDPQNSSIILFSPDLEEVFNARAAHITDLVHFLNPHLVYCPLNTHDIKVPIFGNNDVQFCLKPKLKHLLEPDSFQTYFHSMSTLIKMVENYCKKKKLIDLRNPFIAILSDDPLKQVFNVNAFHRKQLIQLLLPHVHYLHGYSPRTSPPNGNRPGAAYFNRSR